MNWWYREPSLRELLSDSLVITVMKADGVDAEELETMLRIVAASRSRPLHDAPPGQLFRRSRYRDARMNFTRGNRPGWRRERASASRPRALPGWSD
jgi:hypothetical protein